LSDAKRIAKAMTHDEIPEEIGNLTVKVMDLVKERNASQTRNESQTSPVQEDRGVPEELTRFS
jgi:hypothetical protein